MEGTKYSQHNQTNNIREYNPKLMISSIRAITSSDGRHRFYRLMIFSLNRWYYRYEEQRL